MSKVSVFIQVPLVTIVSAPSFKKINSGARLVKKASLTAVFTCEVAQCAGRGCGLRVVRRGRISKTVTKRREEVIKVVSMTPCLIFIKVLVCKIQSVKSGGGVEKAWGSNRGGEGLAIFTAVEPFSVSKEVLTSVFRITI